ncbi:type IV inositol polyphosphate 5-phosphatase 11 [Syzygium oleosum]|uniref:type IV inositol polyphosphate 5-phosphatase 11 n=1 Tax=Syzygium oleosum TaxID=219896 RepID=UPI0011D1A315|nr:type IV inositol polyphosphate 5-phosphatase 11 [Syzygium oleosum]
MVKILEMGYCCGRRSKTEGSNPTDDMVGHVVAAQQEGIRTVRSCNSCEFSSDPDVCICLVTWNMNGQVSHEDLAELVGSKRKFDLLVVGLQEAPRKSISRMLQATLAETHVLLGKAIMQSVQLYIFGPKDSELYTNELKVDKQSVGGLGGLIRRKKGAVAIHINFRGIRMVFISCHLSAHAHNVEERNSQFRHISHSLFTKSKHWNPYASPAQLTIWLGDLNYRLQGIDTQPARKLIRKDLHTMLIGKDQLLQEAERGEIFSGYSEGTLKFKPTYKYDVGSSDYDTSHKVRVPSWTDRILFKIEDADKVKAILRSYESVDCIESSDHKPVKAHLCLKLNPNHDQ